MIEIFFGFALLASAITTNKMILSLGISPSFFVALRMLCASIFLLTASLWKSEHFRFSKIKNDLLIVAGIALLTTAIPSVLKAYALQNLPSAKAAFLGSLDPFFTALLAYLLLAERLTLTKILGILVGFSGALILLISSTPQETSFISLGFFSLPELAALAAVVIVRYGWIEAQKLLKAERYSAIELNGLLMLLGGFSTLVPSLMANPCAFSTIPCTGRFFWLFIYTVIVGNLIAYTLYATFLKKYSTTLVSLAGLSVPLCVQAYGWLLLHEEVSWSFIAAFAVTLLGMYIFYRDELGGRTKKITV